MKEELLKSKVCDPNELKEDDELFIFLQDFDDEIIALAIHLDLTAKKINEIGICNDIYDYGNQTYFVGDDDAADSAWDEYLDSYIDDCLEIPEQLRFYFDDEKWKNDAKIDGRGHSLSSYDGREYSEEVNGIDYYIYRQN